ncbi:MAG: hypothetical protein JWR72_2178 [Flavisolibacter sp.]|jgi:hypothetical protein|nr:hypothetical protein [Flavisolibacter sp.]
MIIPQGKDKMWILTDGGIFFYDLLKNAIKKIPFDKEKYGYGMASMHDGEFVNSDEILISMARPGFVLFNTRTLQFRPAPPPFDPFTSKKYNETGGVLKDSKGRIWLANSVYGLVEYILSGNSIYPLKSEPSYPVRMWSKRAKA